jgi:hypothetical protein
MCIRAPYLDGADNAVDDDADELRDAAVAQLRAAVDAAAPCAASRAAPPATRRAMESARNDARLALVKALGASYYIPSRVGPHTTASAWCTPVS